MVQFQTPTDKLYQQGVPFQPDRITEGIRLDNTMPQKVMNSVDWGNTVEQDRDVDYATSSATAHFHYQKLSNLLLCDKIILGARNVPEPVQRAATLIGQRNAQELRAWTEYLHQSGGGGTIVPEQREYYQVLFSQRDVLPVLLGVQTWNVALDPSYDQFQTGGDPVFQKLTGGFAQQNIEEYKPIRDAFREAIQPMATDDRMRLLQRVAQLVDLTQMTKQRRDDDIHRPLNSNADESINRGGERIKQFYQEIGLIEDIFEHTEENSV